MDNVPNWEFGVAHRVARSGARAAQRFQPLADAVHRGQGSGGGRSVAHSPNDRWLLPSSESQYRKAIEHVDGYFKRLGDNDGRQRAFLRAGRQSGRLPAACLDTAGLVVAAPVGQCRPDSRRRRGRPASAGSQLATPRAGAWSRHRGLKIDDNFYEARGYTWALLEQLKAIQVDFGPILRSKTRCEPRTGDPRARRCAETAAQSDGPERITVWILRQPLVGDGQLRIARERRHHRPARVAEARLRSRRVGKKNGAGTRRSFFADRITSVRRRSVRSRL